MSDFFGYNRVVKPNGTLVTSEYATLSLDTGGKMALVQNVQAQYGQQVIPHFECGSATLYWTAGHPAGQVGLSRLVGAQGFANNWDALQNCGGTLFGISMGLDGASACAQVQTSGKKLRFEGGITTGVSWGWNAQSLDVTEGAQILVSEMSLS